MTVKSKNIVLADDSVFFRTMLSDLLTKEGHNIVKASDGGQVMDKFRENPNDIDLAIIALKMPGVDGFKVIEWLKENSYTGRVPVLAVSGVYSADDVVPRLKELGASGFMTKGCSPEKFIDRVNQLLFPKEADMRRLARVPVAISADYTQHGMPHKGSLLNVSANGLFMHARRDLGVGTEVALKFTLPKTERVFDVQAVVKWTTPPGKYKTLIDGVGVMFTSITDEESEEIRRFVERENSRFIVD